MLPVASSMACERVTSAVQGNFGQFRLGSRMDKYVRYGDSMYNIYIYTVSDRHLEYEKSFTRDRIRSTDTVLKANASGVRIWHKCS